IVRLHEGTDSGESGRTPCEAKRRAKNSLVVRLSAWRAGSCFCDSHLSRLSPHETKEARLKPRTSKLHHENVIPASLLHNQEGADGQDVRAGTVEAADG